MSNSNQSDLRLLLGTDLNSVDHAFFVLIRRSVEEVIPVLDPNVSYKAEHLLGAEMWESLSNGERRLAGRCLSYMVASGQLRLSVAPTRHEYPKRYLLA
jgi:hypothetical protein